MAAVRLGLGLNKNIFQIQTPIQYKVNENTNKLAVRLMCDTVGSAGNMKG